MQNPIRYFDDPKPTLAKRMIAVLLGLMVAIAIVGAFAPVRAEGASKPKVAKAAVAEDAPANPWTGCHVGLHGGAAASSTQVAGVVSLSSEGTLAGLGFGCDMQLPNTPFVIGAAAGYTWRNLDATFAGAKVDMKGAWDVTVRGGVTAGKLLVYALAGYTQTEASASLALPDQFDGWVAGVGVEAMLTSSLSLSLEHRSTFYKDEPIVGLPGLPGIEPTEHQLRLGGKWRLPALLK